MKKRRQEVRVYRSEGKIEAVEWNDNSVVTLYSNDRDVEPFNKVKRRVKERVICMQRS